MIIKFLLPRKLYYLDFHCGSGWVGIVIENGITHLSSAGYGFKQTFNFLLTWDK